MRVLTAAEGAVLSQAREILYELSHGFTGESLATRTDGQRDTDGGSEWARDYQQRDVGRSTHAAEIAEGAIFGFLNTVAHHLDDPIARLNLERQADRGIADHVEEEA